MGRDIHALEGCTRIMGDKVLHYTCNSPKQGILNKKGIEAVGEEYGVGNNEMLVIPLNLYGQFGISPSRDRQVLIMQTESLLTKLD
jgi:hypothetical protein